MRLKLLLTLNVSVSHKLCVGVMNIPCMTRSTYLKKELQIEKDIATALDINLKAVAEEEIQHSQTDHTGIPLGKCYADCAWCKRSYKTKYNALSGAASIIGHYTKKVLYIGVANKDCRICQKSFKNGNVEPPEHKCNRNYVGPSTGMESKIITDGFRECMLKYNIRFSHLIGDGDSSVIFELNKAQIYNNPILQIEKIECVNHLLRNLRSLLRALAAACKANSLYLTEVIIQRMIKALKCARKHWNESGELWDVKVGNFRKDINNIPCHVFGEHKDCAEYFCKEPKENEKNFVLEMKANGLFKKIMDCFSRARLNARSLLINENTNIVEQLHSLFVKYNGGKRLHFAPSHSFGTRAKMGVLQHNTGRLHSTIFEATNQITNDLIKSIEFRRQCQNLNKKMKDTPFEDRQKNQQSIAAGGDANYGLNPRTADMDPSEYELEKERFLGDLRERQSRHISIERETIGQRDCDKWKTYRYGLLTASNFGLVCCARSPESYSNIVKSILYTKLAGLKEIEHGNTNEHKAIRALEELERVSIDKCGLFIDVKNYCLGASPDGLIGQNGIVEVKCPYSIYGQNIDDAIRAGKCTVWKRERKKRTALQCPKF